MTSAIVNTQVMKLGLSIDTLYAFNKITLPHWSKRIYRIKCIVVPALKNELFPVEFSIESNDIRCFSGLKLIALPEKTWKGFVFEGTYVVDVKVNIPLTGGEQIQCYEKSLMVFSAEPSGIVSIYVSNKFKKEELDDDIE